MDPNSQAPVPPEQSAEAMPDAKEPDTASTMASQPEQAPTPPADVQPVTEVPGSMSTPPAATPVSSPLPSSDPVVNPTTPTTMPTMAMGSATPKKKTRLVLVIVLVVVILVAAGLILYVSTLGK